jgi:hypothetical protein
MASKQAGKAPLNTETEAPPVVVNDHPTAVLDLNEFDPLVASQEAGRECTINNPATGQPLSLKITVCGKGSRRYKKATRWLSDKQMERAMTGSLIGEALDDEIGFLARLCVGWTNCLVDGKELEFSTEAAEAIFQRFPFVVDQVDAFAGRAANFMNA